MLDKEVIGAFAQAFRPAPTPAPDPVRRALSWSYCNVGRGSLAAGRRNKTDLGRATIA